MWIDVNDALPLEGKPVLIFVPKSPDAPPWHKDKYYVACYYYENGDIWFIDDDNYREVGGVSHWQRIEPLGVGKAILDE